MILELHHDGFQTTIGNILSNSRPHSEYLNQNHSIKSLQDLKHVLNTIPSDDWEELCRLLGVDKTIINDVTQLHRYNYEKLSACLNHFFNSGRATWENVVYAIASSPLNRVVLAKEVAWNYEIEYYAVMNLQKPSRPAQPDDHVIKKYQHLSDVVKLKLSSEDWKDICRLLDVDEATMVDLKRSNAYNYDKHTFCLHDFFNIGVATWERVIRAIASPPLNKVVLAKETAWKYEIEYYVVMNLQKPYHPAQPDDHVIKKYQHLSDVAKLKLASEDWEDICRLLDVDEATMVDLKRSNAYNYDKHTFCVRDFFNIGVATWERVIRAIASDPLNRIVLAKETAWAHDMDYYKVMNFKKPTRPAQPDDHVIKKYQHLSDVAKLKLSSEDWEDICRLLDVDEATVVDLKRSNAYNYDKHTFCVRDFFIVGIATWERLVRAIASKPLNQVVLGKEIAQKYGFDFKEAVAGNSKTEL